MTDEPTDEPTTETLRPLLLGIDIDIDIARGMVRDHRKYAFNSPKIRFLYQILNYPPMPLISENNGSLLFFSLSEKIFSRGVLPAAGAAVRRPTHSPTTEAHKPSRHFPQTCTDRRCVWRR
jgi:hypothetical protein